jgi:hypothetical protein
LALVQQLVVAAVLSAYLLVVGYQALVVRSIYLQAQPLAVQPVGERTSMLVMDLLAMVKCA